MKDKRKGQVFGKIERVHNRIEHLGRKGEFGEHKENN